jgi:hydroxymethylpyrimidine pyrophosphatase-like HAD family hydrolase
MKPNNKQIHFFDLDGTLWNMESKIWVIDKENPSTPIIKLTQYEINKIINGFYKNDNIIIKYNDEEYFISDELLKKINKKKVLPIERIGISWIEFIDKKYINITKVNILLNNIKHLKDKDILVSILTGRAYRERYGDLINKLRLILKNYNLEFWKIYFVGDKIYKQVNNKIAFNKAVIILEHMIGLKIKDSKFQPLQQDWFTDVYFYDDERFNIDFINNIQDFFQNIFQNSDDDIKQIILEKLQNNTIKLTTNLITNNEVNPFQTNTIILKNMIKFPILAENNSIKNFMNFING